MCNNSTMADWALMMQKYGKIGYDSQVALTLMKGTDRHEELFNKEGRYELVYRCMKA